MLGCSGRLAHRLLKKPKLFWKNRVIGNGFNAKQEQYGLDYVFKPNALTHGPEEVLGMMLAGIPASVECGAGNRVWVLLPGVMQRASRLKRELSLLAAEPPPGITCWQDGDRMEDLRAQILGGANTPYEKGVFKLEVNIPERYPFEPPQIRFLTPIYHPNIDSAGRICLDVLKLPPKGAWRPSLNIATLLTSVQQLMAEPNPDDPLMADIVSAPGPPARGLLSPRPALRWGGSRSGCSLADEEETPDSPPEAGDSEGHSAAQKRRARHLGGVEKKFCPDV
ncbi:hypothetical protein E2I00_010379 [Balaenoptera physalus]|uniref:Ubiquitin-conjugating enzyme E2 T n=1 Tax=Balaenoptera physalus TaxID=9770 RepID=A0A6A1QF70_BALPH|nr:hypothetical protein E2I00_010379 [Balaenoptera physalus]